MAAKLTTHALDTELGRAAAGMRVELYRRGTEPELILSSTLDAQGRATLLDGPAMRPGLYELLFFVADYHRGCGAVLAEPPFLDRVPIHFGISDPQSHYHVPLVMSRYGYTTYRGG